MFWLALILLLILCGIKEKSRPFAAVMAANMLSNEVLVSLDLFKWIPVTDTAAFVGIALLTLREPKWWSFLIAELSFAAVVAHVVFWTSYGFGVYLGSQYQIILNGAFLLSVLLLTAGGYDLWRKVGRTIHSLANAFDKPRRYAQSSHASAKNARKVQK